MSPPIATEKYRFILVWKGGEIAFCLFRSTYVILSLRFNVLEFCHHDIHRSLPPWFNIICAGGIADKQLCHLHDFVLQVLRVSLRSHWIMEVLTKISGKSWNVRNCVAYSEFQLTVSDRITKEARTRKYSIQLEISEIWNTCQGKCHSTKSQRWSCRVNPAKPQEQSVLPRHIISDFLLLSGLDIRHGILCLPCYFCGF